MLTKPRRSPIKEKTPLRDESPKKPSKKSAEITQVAKASPKKARKEDEMEKNPNDDEGDDEKNAKKQAKMRTHKLYMRFWRNIQRLKLSILC